MLDRDDPAFKEYGAENITVCERWQGKQGFQNFLSDLGPKPTKAHTLDRYPDQKGNYGPENCRWATKWREQQQNRSSNRMLTAKALEAG